MKPSEIKVSLPKNTKIINDSVDIKSSPNDCACFKADNAKTALKEDSDVVFSGVVSDINNDVYTFQTERVWKGIVENKASLSSPPINGDCAVRLTKGARYIVFARKAELTGAPTLTLMPCNFTTDLASGDGKNILKEIGKGKSVKKASTRKKRKVIKSF